ncbi:uncharacterized protein LOC144785164 [Lissotriton helveticus]
MRRKERSFSTSGRLLCYNSCIIFINLSNSNTSNYAHWEARQDFFTSSDSLSCFILSHIIKLESIRVIACENGIRARTCDTWLLQKKALVAETRVENHLLCHLF